MIEVIISLQHEIFVPRRRQNLVPLGEKFILFATFISIEMYFILNLVPLGVTFHIWMLRYERLGSTL
jgi:hypothetical protein